MAEMVPMALSLPARYYIDPDYYRAELEWFFGGMWFYAGRADEIPEPGRLRAPRGRRREPIVVRGDRGEINAFYNVCRHRGTRLCEQDSGGSRVDDPVPLSRLGFDLDGRLVAAPHMERWRVSAWRLSAAPAGGRRLGRARLPQPPGAAAPRWRTSSAGMDERFRAWGMGSFGWARRVIYDVAANWKLIIHNYSECLHCPGVHPALQKLSHYLSGENEPADDGYLGGRMGLRDGIATLSLDGRPRRACLPGLDASECRYVYFYAVLPNLLLSLHPDYVMTHTLWPRGVGPDRDRLRVAVPPRRDRRAPTSTPTTWSRSGT